MRPLILLFLAASATYGFMPQTQSTRLQIQTLKTSKSSPLHVARARQTRPSHTDEGFKSIYDSDSAISSGVEFSSEQAMMALISLSCFAVAVDPAYASDSVWTGPLRLVLDPLLNIGQFAMLLRVIMSWYPDIKITKMPYLLVTFPTEPLLRFTRSIVPPAFGVDISPVVWIAILSFFREILFGQQGLVNML